MKTYMVVVVCCSFIHSGCLRRDTLCADGAPSQEIYGNGIDEDCDGSDAPTLPLRASAAGRYHHTRGSAKLGWHTACGPDRHGDGVGDIAVIASRFGARGFLRTANTALDPGVASAAFTGAMTAPVRGEHYVHDVLDLVVPPVPGAADPQSTATLLDANHGGGMLVTGGVLLDDGSTAQREWLAVARMHNSGEPDASTPGFGSRDIYADSAMSADMHIATIDDEGPRFLFGGAVFDEIPSDGITYIDEATFELIQMEHVTSQTDSAVGDLDADGFDDLAMAFVKDPWTAVVFGPRTGPVDPRDADAIGRYGAPTGELGHSSLATVVADLNADGIADLVVGDQWGPDRRGYVHVWFGPLSIGDHGLEEADSWFEGELPGATAGRGLGVGDVTGDGANDLVIGAHSDGRGDPGLVYVFEGPIQGQLHAADAWAIWHGEEAGAYTGFHISVCDTDRNGVHEIVVGAPHVDAPDIRGFEQPDAGVVYWLDPHN